MKLTALLVSVAFGSTVWLHGGTAVMSRTHATRIQTAPLVISPQSTTITTLRTRRGCLGPVNHNGRWTVHRLPCKGDRVRWILYGIDGGPYGFESLYMLTRDDCPSGSGPDLQANRVGRPMSVHCSPGFAFVKREMFYR